MLTSDLARALWRKSSRSGGNGACVEVARVDQGVALRDSKDPDGPVLAFTNHGWRTFMHGVRRGEFDVSR